MPTQQILEIEQIVKNSRNLPSIPSVAVEILRITESEDGGLPELAEVISLDPALASKLIQLANSPTYAMRSVVTTLERACMLLGLKTVRLMSLSFSLVGVLPRAGLDFDFEQYWRRSLTRAVAGRSLARLAGSHVEEEVFLAGLLSYMGHLVLAMAEPDLYAQARDSEGGQWPDELREIASIGGSSRELLEAILPEWKMPELILFPIRHLGQDPNTLPEASDSAREILRFANAARQCERLLFGDDDTSGAQAVRDRLNREFGLDESALDKFAGNLDAEVAEAADLLNLEIQPVQAVQLLIDAQARLVRDSITVAGQVEQAQRRAAQLESRNLELTSQAQSDALTGLANRGFFDETLARLVSEHSQGIRYSLGLLMVDIDYFKKFNDTYGHQAGDEVLRFVARTIRKSTRGSDLPARYGGEEFAVLMPGATRQGAESLADRLREAIAESTLAYQGQPLKVTVSIGVSLLARVSDASASRDLLTAADNNLYKAKRAGRNRVCID